MSLGCELAPLASRSQGDSQSIKGNIEVTTEGVDYFTSAHSDKLDPGIKFDDKKGQLEPEVRSS